MRAASLPPASVQVMARTGFTDSPCAILALHRWGITAAYGGLEPVRRQRFPPPVNARIRSLKRLLLALVVLCGLAAVYGYVVTDRENRHRELIRQGDAAMAAGDLSTAIEAFSGAITLKSDSMIGYLMRGDAYRRRDEL